jgi:hypothetical protein
VAVWTGYFQAYPLKKQLKKSATCNACWQFNIKVENCYMKPKLTMAFAVIIVLACCMVACTKDHVKDHYVYYTPVYKTRDEIKANIRSNNPVEIVQTGKLAVKDNYIYLNEPGKGVHIIDASNPASPRNLAFIDIPGNVEVAVRGNYLYADCYTALAVVDISNPRQVALKQFVNGVFPVPYYPGYFVNDTSRIIAEWQRHDTVATSRFSESFKKERQDILMYQDFMSYAASSASSGGVTSNGLTGSMSRFALLSNRLYALNNGAIKVFNTTDAAAPVYTNTVPLNQNALVETIYPFGKQLFIGTQAGMLIYGTANADQPSFLGKFEHVRVCDPVIADEKNAYVTLHSGTACGGFTNQLDVLDITNLLSPALLKTYPLRNPKGLSKDGNLLFVCDGNDGLKLYDASTPTNLVLLKQVPGVDTYDVIARNKYALVVAADGLYFVDYTEPATAHIVSRIDIAKK